MVDRLYITDIFATMAYHMECTQKSCTKGWQEFKVESMKWCGISTGGNVFLKWATLEKSNWWDILDFDSQCTCLNELLDPACNRRGKGGCVHELKNKDQEFVDID